MSCFNINNNVLQNGLFYKNAEFIFCLDRQKDTLSLTDLFVQNLQIKFVKKLNPYSAFLQKQNKGFSISLFPRPFSKKRGEVRSGVFIKGHPRRLLSGNSSILKNKEVEIPDNDTRE